jgi:hypothetical protein
VRLSGCTDRGDELDIDLDPVARLGFLAAFPVSLAALVALGARQPDHVETVQDVPHPSRTDRDVVVALEMPRDLVRPEVAALTQALSRPRPQQTLRPGCCMAEMTSWVLRLGGPDLRVRAVALG